MSNSRTRKTVRISDVRAMANHYLAASADDLTGFREGVAHMYSRLAMDANDYHGYNDLVQLWDADYGDYLADESYRRVYFGEMTGEYADSAREKIAAFRERMQTTPNNEYRRRYLSAAHATTETPRKDTP